MFNLQLRLNFSSLFLPAGAHERLVLRLLYVLRVCLFVCLSVCASALIPCTMYYIVRYYATAVYSSFWAKLQQMKVVLCCLDGETW